MFAQENLRVQNAFTPHKNNPEAKNTDQKPLKSMTLSLDQNIETEKVTFSLFNEKTLLRLFYWLIFKAEKMRRRKEFAQNVRSELPPIENLPPAPAAPNHKKYENESYLVRKYMRNNAYDSDNDDFDRFMDNNKKQYLRMNNINPYDNDKATLYSSDTYNSHPNSVYTNDTSLHSKDYSLYIPPVKTNNFKKNF